MATHATGARTQGTTSSTTRTPGSGTTQRRRRSRKGAPDTSGRCTVEIRPMEGGDDAAAFAGELADALTKWARRQHVNVRDRTGDQRVCKLRVDVTAADMAGRLAGVHRVQRIPASDTRGRRHTSTVEVTVVGPQTVPDIQLDPADVDVSTYRSSGAGGQHRNVTDSAVRLTHQPSGLVVTCADERSQHRNLASAWAEMERRLRDDVAADNHARTNQVRAEQTGGQARRFTHNDQRNETVDHDTGRSWQLDRFLKGRW